MNLTETIETEIRGQTFTDKVLIRPDTLYAWTIAPNDKSQGLGVRRPKNLGSLTRLQKVENQFTTIFADMAISNIEYLLYTEITEPFHGKGISGIPRIHYHGYIYFPDGDSVLQFLQYEALSLSTLCMQTIKPLHFEDDGTTKWETDYLQKQQFLGIHKIKTPFTTNIKRLKTRSGSPSNYEPPERHEPRLEDTSSKQCEAIPTVQRKTTRGTKTKKRVRKESNLLLSLQEFDDNIVYN